MMGKVVAAYDGRGLRVTGKMKKLIKNQNVFRPELQKGGRRNEKNK